MAHSGLPQHPPKESVIGGTADIRLSASGNQPLLQFRPPLPSRDVLFTAIGVGCLPLFEDPLTEL